MLGQISAINTWPCSTTAESVPIPVSKGHIRSLGPIRASRRKSSRQRIPSIIWLPTLPGYANCHDENGRCPAARTRCSAMRNSSNGAYDAGRVRGNESLRALPGYPQKGPEPSRRFTADAMSRRSLRFRSSSLTESANHDQTSAQPASGFPLSADAKPMG